MDQERVTRIQAALRDAKLDALVLRLPENIVMSLGCWPMNGCSWALFTAAHGPAALVAPSCEDEEMGGCWAPAVRYFVWPRLSMPDPVQATQTHLRALAAQFGVTKGRLGYEGGFDAVAPAHNAGEVLAPCPTGTSFLHHTLPEATWVDATPVLYELRATKTAYEVQRLRTAHQVAGFGLEAFHAAVAPGVTEAALAARVYEACLTRGVALAGVGLVNAYPQISSGANAHRAWRPIVTTGARRVREGEIAVLEMAVCVDGFWADVTRVKAAGKPTDVQQRAFAAVQAAQATALAAIKAGVPACVPHQRATQVLNDAGFARQVVHLTGHGVGFRYHEPEPFLMPGNDAPLRAGHVCSVEPGLYDPAWGGIRLEDNVVVGDDAAEVLTSTPKVL